MDIAVSWQTTEAPSAIPSWEAGPPRRKCLANVGWISRRRNPTFERVGAVAVLGRWMSPVRGKRRKRLRRFRHTDADPPCIDSPPPNSKTPRTKARRLVCSGGYNRFAVNDGLRFANPSYELIRLTAFIDSRSESDCSERWWSSRPSYRLQSESKSEMR